ncbi:hypothetical protein ACIQXD_25660 [Streptomyces uncialis]|uniref:hypothetical protein n=1 Tax=Streptomyces uncialis TaxID=1048205 RepID=UPI00382FF315
MTNRRLARAGSAQHHGRDDPVQFVGLTDGGLQVLHEHAEPTVQDGGGVDLRRAPGSDGVRGGREMPTRPGA